MTLLEWVPALLLYLIGVDFVFQYARVVDRQDLHLPAPREGLLLVALLWPITIPTARILYLWDQYRKGPK